MRKKDSSGSWKFFLGLLVGFGLVSLVIIVAGLSETSFSSKIAVVEIEGTISSTPSFFSKVTTPDDVYEQIKKIKGNPSIKGVLFVINSPGGSVVASREMFEIVKGLKKPKVCWMGDMATSGAYWVSLACDQIIADPLSITGSIGVTASYLEFSKLFEKYGVTYEKITSGEHKDIGSPFRNLTKEEREKLEYIVNEIFKYFLDEVKNRRNMTDENIQKITTGDIFLGKDAVKIGLVDSVGSIEDAKDIIKRLSNTEYAEFVTMKKKGLSLFDLLGML